MAFIYLYRQYKRKQAARVAEAEKITQAQADVQAVNPTLEGEGSSPVSPSPLDSPKLQALKPPELDVAEKKSAGWLGLAKEQWMLMGALALPIFLETLDYTVVATAQPEIASHFHRLDLQSYIGTLYLLTSTVFLPLFASFADIYGRHFAIQLSLVIFGLGSALSTGAANMAMMLAGRGVAGIGAAGLLTIVRILLSDSASLDSNNWQSTFMIILYTPGFAAGPAIGGALTAVSFRWIFAINLPCVALSVILSFLLLRKIAKGPKALPQIGTKRHTESETENSNVSFADRFLRVDWISAFFFVSGGILLLLGLNWGSTEQWNSAKVIACLTIGGILLIVCLAWEGVLEHKQAKAISLFPRVQPLPTIFRAEPMIPLAVIKSFDVAVTQFAAFSSGMVMLVLFYFVAIFMTIVTGLSPTKAGVQLIYFAPGLGGGSIVSSYMIRGLRQPKYPIVLGNTIIPIALGLISWALNNNKQSQVNGFMAMAGVGVGLTFGPLAVHARFSQPSDRVAIVVALNLFFRSLGGTVGLAQCSTVLNSKVRSYLANAAANAVASGQTIPTISPEALSSIDLINQLPPEVQQVVRDAFRNGVRWCFISLIPWTALALFGTLFLSKIVDTDKPVVKPAVATASPEEKDLQESQVKLNV